MNLHDMPQHDPSQTNTGPCRLISCSLLVRQALANADCKCCSKAAAWLATDSGVLQQSVQKPVCIRTTHKIWACPLVCRRTSTCVVQRPWALVKAHTSHQNSPKQSAHTTHIQNNTHSTPSVLQLLPDQVS